MASTDWDDNLRAIGRLTAQTYRPFVQQVPLALKPPAVLHDLRSGWAAFEARESADQVACFVALMTGAAARSTSAVISALPVGWRRASAQPRIRPTVADCGTLRSVKHAAREAPFSAAAIASSMWTRSGEVDTPRPSGPRGSHAEVLARWSKRLTWRHGSRSA